MSSSDSQTPQTEMTNPSKGQTRMIKIKAIHPLRVMRGKDEQIVSPGQIVDVTDEEAKEFCDKQFDVGHRNVFGNQEASAARKTYVKRAERVK